MIGALLSMLRRVPVVGADGLLVGRELGGATVGLIGMAPAARSMAQLLGGFGSRVVGYDPSLHASDGVWARWQVEPLGLRELLEQSDARVRAARLLQPLPRPARRALPAVLQAEPGDRQHRAFGPVRRGGAGRRRWRSGRIAAAWLDSLEPGALDPGRPLHGIETLQITPRVASTTRESRLRSAWAVARRIDELLSARAVGAAPSSGRRRQARRLILQPVQRRREVGDALLLLIDHGRRRARDEALVAELGASPSRSRLRAASISLSSRVALGGDVDLDVQRQPQRRPRTATGGVARRLRERGLVVEQLHLRQLARAPSAAAPPRRRTRRRRSRTAARARPATGSSRCAGCGRRRRSPSAARSRRRPSGRPARAAPSDRAR